MYILEHGKEHKVYTREEEYITIIRELYDIC